MRPREFMTVSDKSASTEKNMRGTGGRANLNLQCVSFICIYSASHMPVVICRRLRDLSIIEVGAGGISDLEQTKWGQANWLLIILIHI